MINLKIINIKSIFLMTYHVIYHKKIELKKPNT
jgi:hypothetical protein